MEKVSKSNNTQDTLYPSWRGGIIKHFGTYTFPKRDLELTIRKDKDLMDFELKNRKGKVLIHSPKNMTIYESWGIFLDSRNNFYLHSTDIGDFKWVRNKKDYRRIDLNDNLDTLADIPEEFRNEILP
jgi:hypothetical protein